MLSLPLQDTAYVFAVLFAVILLAPLVAERMRAPGLIGLLLAGTLIGPFGLGLVERSGVVASLGEIGLLYLMFVSGLDLDLGGFRRHRRDSILFGSLTFVIPTVILVAVSLGLDLDLAAASMMASAFTSHTLLTLPVVQRVGIMRNRAVTATLGATLLSTVAALLVLAVAAAAGAGQTGLRFWVGLPVGLVVLLAGTIWGLPALTRWIFRGVGQDRAVRLLFLLAAMFSVSALAALAGIEPIVGAFLAGLATNRFVPEGNIVRVRLDVLGSALFIPLFLISTGMLIDPVTVVSDPRILTLGAAFTAAAVGAKVIAAGIAARVLGFGGAELGMMVSLSSGQAAGALAAVIVAEQLGLVGQEVVNATVLVILVTALFAAVLAQRYAPRVTPPRRGPVRLGERVLVSVANPAHAEPLVRLAALVAGPDHGSVGVVNVLGFGASAAEVDDRRAIIADAERVALAAGAEADTLVRVDASPIAGVLHTAVEWHATCVLLGWKGRSARREHLFGSIIDGVIARGRVPVVVAHPGQDGTLERVVLTLSHHDVGPSGIREFGLAVEVATRIAAQAEVELHIISEDELEAVRPRLPAEWRDRAEFAHDPRRPPIALRERTRAGDLVVVGTSPAGGRLSQRAERLGRAVRDRTLVVVVPH